MMAHFVIILAVGHISCQLRPDWLAVGVMTGEKLVRPEVIDRLRRRLHTSQVDLIGRDPTQIGVRKTFGQRWFP
jgi:hypothetical protein